MFSGHTLAPLCSTPCAIGTAVKRVWDIEVTKATIGNPRGAGGAEKLGLNLSNELLDNTDGSAPSEQVVSAVNSTTLKEKDTSGGNAWKKKKGTALFPKNRDIKNGDNSISFIAIMMLSSLNLRIFKMKCGRGSRLLSGMFWADVFHLQ
ncbi:hypothetical protein Ancab_021205 [Ancistrocladus abbreviatus]